MSSNKTFHEFYQTLPNFEVKDIEVQKKMLLIKTYKDSFERIKYLITPYFPLSDQKYNFPEPQGAVPGDLYNNRFKALGVLAGSITPETFKDKIAEFLRKQGFEIKENQLFYEEETDINLMHLSLYIFSIN